MDGTKGLLFPGHGREIGLLRTALDRNEPSVVGVHGPSGAGKTTLVRAAAADYLHVYHRAPPLPAPSQRCALARALRCALPDDPAVGALGDDPSWEDTFLTVVAVARERPLVLVVDDAHRWTQSRSRFEALLRAALSRAGEVGSTVHVVLVSPEPLAPTPPGRDARPPLQIRLGPLPFRAAAELLPGTEPEDLLRAYAVFGGLPGHLRHLDRGTSLVTNLRRLVLEPGAVLSELPLTLLESAAQTPSRYAAILSALSAGEADWGTVHAGVADLTASGQVAPYLKRLEDLALVEAHRSLDASPRSRGRRYRIVDPFVAFWFRFILPHRETLDLGRGEDVLSSAIRPALDQHLASLFPDVCRQHMDLDVMETLGANAREYGGLWGADYEIPVAGTLASGAVFYGVPVRSADDTIDALARLDRDIRETRYGFGRERRLRIVFSPGAIPGALQREAARRHDLHLVDAAALLGA
jgi:hypothetical protein